jgi:hypothetical protein
MWPGKQPKEMAQTGQPMIDSEFSKTQESRQLVKMAGLFLYSNSRPH